MTGVTRTLAALALAGLAIGGAGLATKSTADSKVREIRLVVRDMSYYLDGTGLANPTIYLSRGERVRLLLVNDDPGYDHNLVAPVLQVSTRLLQHGRSQSVEVIVPDRAGTYPYECRPHSEMMRGNIAIE